MVLHMLFQIPLLVLAGWILTTALPRRFCKAVAPWNAYGISGILLASLTGSVWMLPRMLDAAVDDFSIALVKWISVPFLIGMPLALSWPRAGFVVRGVFLLELIATAFRLGWLYLVSPVRLCNSYLLDDQQRLGWLLLAIGVVAVLFLAWQLLWGHIEVRHLDK